jgi:hypothetical protein
MFNIPVNGKMTEGKGFILEIPEVIEFCKVKQFSRKLKKK